jgi:nucleotide-binding universal stress UspA family protein
MSWKRILVHVRAYQDWSESIDVAIRVAKTFDARLTGLYTIRELAMLKILFGKDNRAVREAEARDAPLMQRAKARFMEACIIAGVGADWQIGEGNAAELLNLAGRCHDLIVVEQSRSGLDSIGSDVAEECAVASGVPTLIVPKSGMFATVGQRVVVAWNHSRQSASALRAALPMIEHADQVIVLLGKERDILNSVTRRPEHDIVAYLRSHARAVEAVPFEANDADTGSRLLAATHEARGDVLVMGAYGRSAWREFIFGGATKHIADHLDLPVLMAN